MSSSTAQNLVVPPLTITATVVAYGATSLQDKQETADDIPHGQLRVSLRPRFAGDGRLQVPEYVTIARSGRGAGNVRGEFVTEETDPFERDAEGLLLAEAFARFDFTRPRKARDWFLAHGAVNVGSLFPDDASEGEELIDGYLWCHDTRDEVLEQQRLVAWHLTSLARLTTHRAGATPPDPAWRPHEGWEAAWSMAILETTGDALWVGAPVGSHGYFSDPVQRYATRAELPGHHPDAEHPPEGPRSRRDIEEWSSAHEQWQRLVAVGLPRLWVPRANWDDDWSVYGFDERLPHGRRRWGRLSSDWHALLELQRRLIEPYVKRAANFEVEVDRERRWVEEPDATGHTEVIEPELLVRERRLWRSILAPIYLQLLEALRRVSEGKPGALWCKECGQPFLTLDARRSTFCTDRERLRYAQRDRRERVAADKAGAT